MRCAKGCDCGCCGGVAPITPRPIWNRPGRDKLDGRIGEHGAFFETMQARLSSSDFPELEALTVRTPDDPAIALLDAWATVADVLTFYQERVANEGYLATATERRSVLELGRLIGYQPRPGVAASVHLSYEIDTNAADPVEIEAGAKAQSLPAPGELPQTFETVETFTARKEWNAIKPRILQPTTPKTLVKGTKEEPGSRVFLQGIATGLKPGDALLITRKRSEQLLVRVTEVEADPPADRTRVRFERWRGGAIELDADFDNDDDDDDVPADVPADPGSLESMRAIVRGLLVERSVPPRNAHHLARDPDELFASGADIGIGAVKLTSPRVATALGMALASAGSEDEPIRIFAMRRHSLLFGATATHKVTTIHPQTGAVTTAEWTDEDVIASELTDAIHLEAPNEKLGRGGWIVLDYGAVGADNLGRLLLPQDLNEDQLLIARAGQVSAKLARSVYATTGQTTRAALANPGDDKPLHWFAVKPRNGNTMLATVRTDGFRLIRNLDVLCESEELPLALEPITEPVCGGDKWIETDGLYSDLESGRWLVVKGRRADIPGTEAVEASELVMLSGVRHDAPRVPTQGDGRDTNPAGVPGEPAETRFAPGESLHTYIQLAKALSYCYARDSVVINANVVKATHGDTRVEPLGSGDGSKPHQRFTLRQPPLTYVAANEPDGIASTLRLYVDGVEWREAPAVSVLGPVDRGFTTETDNEQNLTLRFGDGVRGARLPTGVNNIEAVYRSGIGLAGNVKARQISQLLTRPLGVRGVENPIEASGGSDPDSLERMRVNAPLSTAALDRLISVGDYAAFARTFAGIAKAQGAKFNFGGRSGIWLTIAGNDDIDLPADGDLRNILDAALTRYGDPDLPVNVLMRERLWLVLSAKIAIRADYRWEDVVGRVRATLLARFSFERQGLGASVALSAVIATIHGVRGVDYVDVDALGAVSNLTDEGEVRAPEEIAAAFRAISDLARSKGVESNVLVQGMRVGATGILPAQIAFFEPALPDSLILNRIEPQ